jgi:hypothetical protein
MHAEATVDAVLKLHEEGLNNCEISRRTGVSRTTIRDWAGGKPPHSFRPKSSDRVRSACVRCRGNTHRLGDGSIAAHRRNVYRLRITLDVKYPLIVRECEASMRKVVPRNRVSRQLRRCNCYEVHAYSKHWPCLFPQHGPGPKHTRRIYLAGWQQKLAERWPEQLVKGMIQSDGCRFVNTGRGGWRHPRYGFTNVSTDITSIFCSACDCLGLRWTAAFPKDETAAVSIYVSRKEDVARLDEFVGAKR